MNFYHQLNKHENHHQQEMHLKNGYQHFDLSQRLLAAM